MTRQQSPSIVSGVVPKVIAFDVVVVAAAAAVAWFLHMRTLRGFGVALVRTGGTAGLIGGMAALAQWMLTRIGKGKEVDASHGASGPRLDRALGGGDYVLQVLVAIAGSGVFWTIAGGLITQFLH